MANANISGLRRRPYCVFTSAGDSSNVAGWIPPDGERDWDLVIGYYGKDDAAYKALSKHADVIIRVQGGKFQNLQSIVARQPGLLQGYKHVWVADDDLIFTAGNVSQMFETAARYGFLLCQPGFSGKGRISHPITKASTKGTVARLVNFVEVTCPLFETETLLQFLAVLDPQLVSWGTDWWFSQFLGLDTCYRIAILDQVVVMNPWEQQRTNKSREINNLLGANERYQQWLRTAEAYKLREFPHKTLAEIFPPAPVETSVPGVKTTAPPPAPTPPPQQSPNPR